MTELLRQSLQKSLDLVKTYPIGFAKISSDTFQFYLLKIIVNSQNHTFPFKHYKRRHFDERIAI